MASPEPTPRLLPIAPAICYHTVLPVEESSFVYNVAPADFLAHMQLVARHGAPSLAVSFDDGHASVHRHALPALEQEHVSATLFITAGWIGERAGYLNWKQLAEIAHLGHPIGAHGWSHAMLTHCDDRALAEELHRPKQTLEDRLGREVTALSLPGGRGDDRVLTACAATGYRQVYTSDPCALPARRCGVEVIGRFMARRDMPSSTLARLLSGDPEPLRALRRRRELGRRLKGLLGDRVYHWLWTRWAHVAEDAP